MRKLLWIAFAIISFISGCTKIESTSIGSGLIPPVDGVTTLDTTLEVITNNFHDTSADSLLMLYSYNHVIGVINNDLLFGKTTAEAYLELKPTSYKFAFPGNTTLEEDSVVLVLSYRGVYGDKSIPQKWEVYELATTIRGDTTYNVKTSFETIGNPLTTVPKTIDIPQLFGSDSDRFENAVNQIRIKLAPSFAHRFMKEYDSAVNHPYASDSLFRVNFKGFLVKPAVGSPGNALIQVSLTDTNTKLALYYRYKSTDTKTDTAVSYFRFSAGTSVAFSGSANHIKRDYTGSQTQAAWASPANINSQYSFVQTSPGSFTTIKIPGLSTLPNAIIHRAELLTFQIPDADPRIDTILTPPQFLLLNRYDSTAKVKRNIPSDFVVSSGIANIGTFGGIVSEKLVPDFNVVKAYTFDLTRYVQGIVTRKDTSFMLRLSAPVLDSLTYTDPYPVTLQSGSFYFRPSNPNPITNNAAIGRVKLGGGGLPVGHQLRMRLRIIYSKI